MTDTEHPVFLVFGATGSVGSALSHRLSTTGNHVMMAGRKRARLDDLSRTFSCPSTTVEATDPTSIEQAFDDTIAEFGRIDGVANCVGSVTLKPAHLTNDEDWNQTIAINLTSAFLVVRSAVKRMRKKGGSVVLVSSAAARVGLANHEAIAAAKAGIIGLTLSAAASYATRNIRINAVAPGLVQSNMTRQLWEDPAAAQSSIQMHALGRLGDPNDVASAIDWLLQPSNNWITGQVIGVDGGLGCIVPRPRS